MGSSGTKLSDLKATTRTTKICFDDDSSEIISFSSTSEDPPKGPEQLVAPFDDETTKNNNLKPSDFLGFFGVFFFFPFIGLAIAAGQDMGIKYGALQVVLFYVLHAILPAF